MLYFILFTTLLIGVFYLFWYIRKQDNTPIKEHVIPFNSSNQVEYKTTREQFLDNYIWACDVFGVGVDYREEGINRVKSRSLFFDTIFVYGVCIHSEYYPKGIEKPNTILNYHNHDNIDFINYMDEFNNIVLQYRKDEGMINEIKELGISPAEYLTHVNKHQPKLIDIE